MKGNITISKNSALLIAGALSLFAMADYVGMIDAKGAGGIVVDGATEEEIAEAILNTMPVGSITFRMDAVDPSTIYGGTWELITGDAAIALGNGAQQTGSILGDNDVVAPLPSHSHSINHGHGSATTSSDTHSHTQYVGQSGSGNPSRHGWNISGVYNGLSSFGSTSSDTHNHTVSIPNYSGNSGSAGVSNATIDVRGARLTLNVWKRVS